VDVLGEPEKALIKQISSIQLKIEQMKGLIIGGADVNGDEIIRLSSEHRRLLTSLRSNAAKNKPNGATALHDYLARKAAEAEHPGDDSPDAGSEPEAAESQ
jgi:hypothetical protein